MGLLQRSLPLSPVKGRARRHAAAACSQRSVWPARHGGRARESGTRCAQAVVSAAARTAELRSMGVAVAQSASLCGCRNRGRWAEHGNVSGERSPQARCIAVRAVLWRAAPQDLLRRTCHCGAFDPSRHRPPPLSGCLCVSMLLVCCVRCFALRALCEFRQFSKRTLAT